VADWTEFGHHFQIERLPEPRMVGAGLRPFRLWDNGHPATGGQWHYDMEGARARARYVLEGSYSRRVAWLEQQVNALTAQRDRERQDAFRSGFSVAWGMGGYGDYQPNEDRSWEEYRDAPPR
jgi:hypothetical protein